MELLSTLGLDWQLLVTQLVNFGLLIAVLTFLVYKPILRLLDERRDRIRSSMNEAKRIEDQAKEMEKVRIEHLKKVDQQAGELLERMKKEAEGTKKDILEAAQREATALLAKAREQMDNDRAKLVSELQRSLSGVVVDLAGKIVERNFTDADQQRLLKEVEKRSSRSAPMTTTAADIARAAVDAAVTMLQQQGMTHDLPKLPKLLADAARAKTGMSTVTLITPTGNAGSLVQSVAEMMRIRLGHDVTIEEKADPSMIGGAVILFGDERIDMSVRGALKRAESTLTAS